ncbi:MAG: hypothetical protein ACTHK0_07460 [Ginsengibacter sp.]
MVKGLLTTFFLLFYIIQSDAQLGAMKMVGKNTKNYKTGFGAFVKTGVPVSDGNDVTLEIGANIFFLNDGYGTTDGTIMCPLKAGYRYTLNGSGKGLYVEPQVGYNLYGVTSLTDDNGETINLKYHGIVAAAGAGYLFSVWNTLFDVNLRYETVIAHGGSNNLMSLGITKSFSFGRREATY